MPYLFDRVRETTTTTGTGSLTLGGTSSGYRTFASIVPNFSSVYYVIEDVGAGVWECGIGSFTSPSTLSRDTITSNSSGTTSALTLGAGTKNVYIDATAASLPAVQGSNYYMPPCTPGGRLSMTSGTPVTTSDVSGASTIYYVPYTHDQCPIYDGTRWQQYKIAAPNLTLSPTVQTTRTCTVTSGSTTVNLSAGTTTGLYVGQPITGTAVTATGQYVTAINSSTQFTMAVAASSTTGSTITFYAANYDIFAVVSGSAVGLEQLAWTDNTNRATALTTQDGRYVKSGDATRLYLGSVRMTSTTSVPDTRAQRFVWNMYNRVPRELRVYESGTSWTYTTAAWRPYNNSTANRVEVFNGLSETSVSVQFMALATSSLGYTSNTGVALDNTTSGPGAPYYASAGGGGVSYFFQPMVTRRDDLPGLGYHYLQAVEYGGGAGSNNIFYGMASAGSGLLTGTTMA